MSVCQEPVTRDGRTVPCGRPTGGHVRGIPGDPPKPDAGPNRTPVKWPPVSLTFRPVCLLHREALPVTAILLDLIETIRGSHPTWDEDVETGEDYCVGCSGQWPCPDVMAVKAAERALDELAGEPTC